MNWRSTVILSATLAALVGTVGAAVLAVVAAGDAAVLGWAQRNPHLLAFTGLGTSLIAVVGAYLIMRSRAKEEYRAHWRSHGH
jgi:hypothetical protein